MFKSIDSNLINPYSFHPCFKKQNQGLNIAFQKSLNKDTFSKKEHYENLEIDPVTKKQKLTPEMFFVNAQGYKKDYEWAKEIAKATEDTSLLVEKKEDFQKIIDCFIEESKEMQCERGHMFEEEYGTLRTPRIDDGSDAMQTYTTIEGKYESFKEKIKCAYKDTSDHSRKSLEFPKALVTNVVFYNDGDNEYIMLLHPSGCDNLKYAENIYKKLINTKNPNEKTINEALAKMHWLIAQNTPWLRGSDTIANGIIKAIYRAYDMEISPLKKGISIDFEAFTRDMEDFVEAYPSFYSVKPSKLKR